MIALHTVEAVKALDIVSVIGNYVQLKKKGNSYSACCPFHDEKTPSFHINDKNDYYKCFGCGVAGDGIEFVMNHKALPFLEAVEEIAKTHNITIEYEEESKEEKERRSKSGTLYSMNLAANRKFVAFRNSLPEDHPAKIQLQRFSDEALNKWQIGYTDGKQIYKGAKENGVVRDYQEAGLLVEKGEQFREFFFNRIIFPIHVKRGNIAGFGGRVIDKKIEPKYLNTSTTPIFDKRNTLYGLYHARESIVNKKRFILTEGYTDVIAMHEATFTETVATLGTSSLSEKMCKELKKLCGAALLLRDGDKAGSNASEKDIRLLLKAGFYVQIAILPENTDPYDLTHSLEIEDPIEWLEENQQDAVIWLSNRLFTDKTPFAKSESISKIAELLALMPDEIVADNYRQQIAKKLKIKASDLKKVLQEKQEEAIEIEESSIPKINLPDGVDAQQTYEDGFYSLVKGKHSTGYYFQTGEKSFVKMTNFVITPLFHKYDQDDNTRIIKIENGVDEAEIVEMPSRALISPDQFKVFLYDTGAYFFSGNKTHLDKLNMKYLHNFPKAYELKTLGWQHEGFFAYYDCIFNGKICYYDKAGLVEHDKRKFFSPAISDIYKNLRKDDDMFENDKYLSLKHSDISFSEWMKLIVKVYSEHANVGIPYVFVSLFRDIVFKVDNNCPHLYCYGQTQSGKSKFGESILAVFFDEMPAFNLNTGTDYAFAQRLARFKNCPVAFNEFDDNVVKDEWFQSIKGAYDGEGRERGTGKRNKTEIQRVNSALILLGQYLSTKDDNSVVNRSLLRSFKQNKDRTSDDIENFEKLKKYEKQGITSMLTEILPYRDELEKEYYTLFNETFKKLRGKLKMLKHNYEERVLRNYCALATMVNFFQRYFDFPFNYETYINWILQEVVQISNLISESDILTDFWITVQTLFDRTPAQVVEGVHFKIDTKETVRLTGDDGDYDKPLGASKQILYIRLTEVQKEYAQAVRREGKQAINAASLSSYLKNREYYLGYKNSEKIGGRSTSCFVFDYEALGITLEKVNNNNNPYTPQPLSSQSTNPDDLPF